MRQAEGRRRAAAMAVLLWSCAPRVWADADLSLARVFVHVPEIFADLSAGSYDGRRGQPYRSRRWWYVRPENRLGSHDFESLSKWALANQIAGLDLSGQPAVDRSAMGQLARARLTGLTYLNLEDTNIDDVSMSQVTQIASLESLHLSGDITDQGVKTLSSLKRLMELTLSHTKVTDLGLSALSGLRDLKTIDLGDTPVTDKGLAALRGLSLERLRLGSGITDQGAQTLAAMKTLRQLNIAQTKISDGGLTKLSHLRLHTLFLGPGISDAGMQALSKMHSLRRLDITGATVTDAGAARLVGLSGLEELALSRTSVSDVLLDHLSKLQRLRYLELSDTRMTSAGLIRLARITSLEVISISAVGTLSLGSLKVLSKLLKLRTIIINGSPLGIEEMDYIQGHPRRQAVPWLLDRLIPSAWADLGPMHQALSDSTNVLAIEPLQDKSSAAMRLSGLFRIHYVESELDHPIAAISNPADEGLQDEPEDFIGEFSVGAEGRKKPEAPEGP